MAPHIAFKTAGQSMLLPVGANSFIGVSSPQAREASWTLSNGEDSPLRCRGILESRKCRMTEGPDTTPKSSHMGTRSRAASNVSEAYAPSHKASSSTTHIRNATPLPKSEVDWLLGTLSKEDWAKFDSKFFLNDCHRRFRELDEDKTGVLSIENLQSSLVDMFPTLQLDLATEGHLIPAMHKSIPSLIATFDSDADGYLNFEDFVKFVKFQQAWRAQFFLSRLASGRFGKKDVQKGIREKASMPHPERDYQELASREVSEPPSNVMPDESSLGSRSPMKSYQGSSRECTFRDVCDFQAALKSIVKSPARNFRSSKKSRKNSMLDASRGAFYCSMASFSSTL